MLQNNIYIMPTREIFIKESQGTFSLFKKQNSDDKKYNFSGISSLRQLLSNEKARVLSVIKTEKPSSLYDLSNKLGRGFKSVYEDVTLLKRFGFVDIIEEKANNRIRHRPVIVHDTITINIRI